MPYGEWRAIEVKNSVCHNPDHNFRVCSTWGNYHFKTFDGDVYYFPGTCNYVFASQCLSAYEEFNIQMRRSIIDGLPRITQIVLKIDGSVIKVLNSIISVDDNVVTPPHSRSGIMIEKVSNYTRLTAKIGLSLMWNGYDALMLELGQPFVNTTCGLCGDFNGIRDNEFFSNGYHLTPIQYGNLQKLNGPKEHCKDISSPDNVKNCSKFEYMCERALTEPGFSNCHEVLDLAPFIKSCMLDFCLCKDLEKPSSCICDTLSEFSRQCAHVGGKPSNWRRKGLCEETCQLNMIYQECGIPCVDTCSNPDRSQMCEDHCIDGCFCAPNTVLDDISNSGCIPKEQCPCTHNSVSYAPGASYSTKCSKCICNGGQWSCADLPCPAICSIEGGAHINTFDESYYTFHGRCHYVLTKDCRHNFFTVLGELQQCGITDSETCLKSVTLLVSMGALFLQVITINPSGSVSINGIFTQLPVTTTNVTIFKPSNFHVIFHTTFGLQLLVQLVPLMQLYITLDSAFKNRMCGLCGNFNNVLNDEFKIVNGLVEGTPAAFANTWKTKARCPDRKDIHENPCSLSVENDKYAKHWCGLLIADDSAFSQCHSHINPNQFYEQCKYDSCNSEKSEDYMCAALSSYVQACASKGIIISNWRANVCSKYTICPKTLVYSYNMTSCHHTCQTLGAPDKTCEIDFVPVDGCGCADGTYMEDTGKCVPRSNCPCYHRGSVVPAGEVIHEEDALCTCNQGKLECIGKELKPQACVAPMVYFDCSNASAESTGTECEKSCQTLDMECYATGCTSGCECPEGLVSDESGGCIPVSQCPCTHNGIQYRSGDIVQVDCNSCQCKNRLWTCTEQQCHGTCMAYGDGNYITFDGKRYNFDGDCEYIVAQDYCGNMTSNGTFRIITENIPCGTTGTTCSKSIKIFLGNFEIKLSDGKVEVVKLSSRKHIPYEVRYLGIYLVIEMKNGLVLIWDKKTSLTIKLSHSFKGTICGLCGNYDGNVHNDFTTRNQLVVVNAEEFGNSWKVSPSCTNVKKNKYPCSVNTHRDAWAQKQCSIIKNGPFKACNVQINPAPYYEACVRDACACDTGGDCECLCTAIAAYSLACSMVGVCISWRSPEVCPLFCDYYNPHDECRWHYAPCGISCLKTCRNPGGACSKIIPKLEGCYPDCPAEKPILDEERMKCVKLDHCPCYLNGNHYEPGHTVPSTQNCESCKCINSEVRCTYDKLVMVTFSICKNALATSKTISNSNPYTIPHSNSNSFVQTKPANISYFLSNNNNSHPYNNISIDYILSNNSSHPYYNIKITYFLINSNYNSHSYNNSIIDYFLTNNIKNSHTHNDINIGDFLTNNINNSRSYNINIDDFLTYNINSHSWNNNNIDDFLPDNINKIHPYNNINFDGFLTNNTNNNHPYNNINIGDFLTNNINNSHPNNISIDYFLTNNINNSHPYNNINKGNFLTNINNSHPYNINIDAFLTNDINSHPYNKINIDYFLTNNINNNHPYNNNIDYILTNIINNSQPYININYFLANSINSSPYNNINYILTNNSHSLNSSNIDYLLSINNIPITTTTPPVSAPFKLTETSTTTTTTPKTITTETTSEHSQTTSTTSSTTTVTPTTTATPTTSSPTASTTIIPATTSTLTTASPTSTTVIPTTSTLTTSSPTTSTTAIPTTSTLATSSPTISTTVSPTSASKLPTSSLTSTSTNSSPTSTTVILTKISTSTPTSPTTSTAAIPTTTSTSTPSSSTTVIPTTASTLTASSSTTSTTVSTISILATSSPITSTTVSPTSTSTTSSPTTSIVLPTTISTTSSPTTVTPSTATILTTFSASTTVTPTTAATSTTSSKSTTTITPTASILNKTVPITTTTPPVSAPFKLTETSTTTTTTPKTITTETTSEHSQTTSTTSSTTTVTPTTTAIPTTSSPTASTAIIPATTSTLTTASPTSTTVIPTTSTLTTSSPTTSTTAIPTTSTLATSSPTISTTAIPTTSTLATSSPTISTTATPTTSTLTTSSPTTSTTAIPTTSTLATSSPTTSTTSSTTTVAPTTTETLTISSPTTSTTITPTTAACLCRVNGQTLSPGQAIVSSANKSGLCNFTLCTKSCEILKYTGKCETTTVPTTTLESTTTVTVTPTTTKTTTCSCTANGQILSPGQAIVSSAGKSGLCNFTLCTTSCEILKYTGKCETTTVPSTTLESTTTVTVTPTTTEKTTCSCTANGQILSAGQAIVSSAGKSGLCNFTLCTKSCEILKYTGKCETTTAPSTTLESTTTVTVTPTTTETTTCSCAANGQILSPGQAIVSSAGKSGLCNFTLCTKSCEILKYTGKCETTTAPSTTLESTTTVTVTPTTTETTTTTVTVTPTTTETTTCSCTANGQILSPGQAIVSSAGKSGLCNFTLCTKSCEILKYTGKCETTTAPSTTLESTTTVTVTPTTTETTTCSLTPTTTETTTCSCTANGQILSPGQAIVSSAGKSGLCNFTLCTKSCEILKYTGKCETTTAPSTTLESTTTVTVTPTTTETTTCSCTANGQILSPGQAIVSSAGKSGLCNFTLCTTSCEILKYTGKCETTTVPTTTLESTTTVTVTPTTTETTTCSLTPTTTETTTCSCTANGQILSPGQAIVSSAGKSGLCNFTLCTKSCEILKYTGKCETTTAPSTTLESTTTVTVTPTTTETTTCSCTANGQILSPGQAIVSSAGKSGLCNFTLCTKSCEILKYTGKCETTTVPTTTLESTTTVTVTPTTTETTTCSCTANGQRLSPGQAIVSSAGKSGLCIFTLCTKSCEILKYTGKCETTTAPSTTLESTATVTVTPTTTETTTCSCTANGQILSPGETIYNTTDKAGWCFYALCSDNCKIMKHMEPCKNITLSQPTTQTSTVMTAPPKGCSALQPSRAVNEIWKLDNCTMGICTGNNTVSVIPLKCPHVKSVTCQSGLQPKRIYDQSGCCYHYECDCVCAGWGGSHYLTFDGTDYTFQGNCTYILVQQIKEIIKGFKIIIDDYSCDAEKELPCSKAIIVFYKSSVITLIQTTVNDTVKIKQIKEIIKGFKIIIDDYSCDAEKELPCSKAIIVFYKSSVITLIQTTVNDTVKIKALVNGKEIIPPYYHDGIRISSSGIAVKAEIIAINSTVTFNGKDFTIDIPYKIFGKNVEGQCGTCTNSKKDDCTLPDGTVISSCFHSAPFWHTKNKKKPHCETRPLTTTPPPIHHSTPPRMETTTLMPTVPTTPCAASDICKIILGPAFSKCHDIVLPKPYYEACVRDGCHNRNKTIICSSLEIYSKICQSKGDICVNWREHTNGSCQYHCPATMEYKSCESKEQPTCSSRYTDKNAPILKSGHNEGCFCPAGKILFAPLDICVDICECIGPDGKPRQIGETWSSNCQDCFCNNATLSIICKPRKCPTLPPVRCKGPGLVPVADRSQSEPCCTKIQCACNVTSCPTVEFDCKPGYEPVLHVDKGECCPDYTCEPKPVCVNNGTEYKPGMTIPQGPCENCKCTNKTDSSTKHKTIECTAIKCDSHCPLGFKYKKVEGQCCGNCTQVDCIIELPNGQPIILQPGAATPDPRNNCTKYECEKIRSQLTSIIHSKWCPQLDHNNCEPGTIHMDLDGCCQTCIPKACTVTQTTTYINHHGCRSKQKVPITYCEGYCKSNSVYSAETNTMLHNCTCCQELAVGKQDIMLLCPDGTAIDFTYTYVKSCGCVAAKCGEGTKQLLEPPAH
ncbi:mucin-2-like [Carcharodon carcharias]|uniref:mucin-2-like n=1 Tax=Carcharodon carcharias TaxID=13397 RepID=UPI001B7F2B35|nr:mucin-2-like [Carcharodon carcharias]